MKMTKEDLVWVEESPFWPILKFQHEVEEAKDLFQFGGVFANVLDREFRSTMELKEVLATNIESIEEFDFIIALIDHIYRKKNVNS